MIAPSNSTDRFLSIHLALGQYPILGEQILERMRADLFASGVSDPKSFEAEVQRLAVNTQRQEGLRDPFGEEPPETWQMRLARVRDQLTEMLYSQHFSFSQFEQLVNEVLSQRGIDARGVLLSLNPELSPLEMVFEQAMAIERLPAAERGAFSARLEESKVVLIRALISDQLRYINVAKEWFGVQDLAEVRRRKLGSGRIGGKAAGMLLAQRILQGSLDPSQLSCLSVPDSYFIGADEMYIFMSINNLVHWNDQKYKPEEEMRADYPRIVQEFEHGAFPPDLLDGLSALLLQVGRRPLIVRSSSLLEDNFGTSFAGKYESIFCANQGSPEENLLALTRAIARVYASTLNPDALLYRRSRGLQDYDERMAILIQTVEGERFGRYFLPHAAGVAFSRNLYRWAPEIRREDGFVRLVWGLGTRAVERVGNDYPRLVALSHPLLRPSNEPNAVRLYSQRYVDLIDLEANAFATLPIADVLKPDYPPLRYLAQLDQDGYLSSLQSRPVNGSMGKLVLTFEELLRRTPFAQLMSTYLKAVERAYRCPVDMEFTLHIEPSEDGGAPRLCISLLQCRPLAQLLPMEKVNLPTEYRAEDVVLATRFIVPEGKVEGVRTVVFVPPEGYFALASMSERRKLARLIGRLNAALAGEAFICVGPGRWGSSNADLGVPIGYGDIYNARALVELSGQNTGLPPEPSLGTHFFQDLLESQIYPLAVPLGEEGSLFNRSFFYDTPNALAQLLPEVEGWEQALRVIRTQDFRPGQVINLYMSDERGQALALLEAPADGTGGGRPLWRAKD